MPVPQYVLVDKDPCFKSVVSQVACDIQPTRVRDLNRPDYPEGTNKRDGGAIGIREAASNGSAASCRVGGMTHRTQHETRARANLEVA